jgi:DNA-directed RNA polymerase I and III subunit RPAC1
MNLSFKNEKIFIDPLWIFHSITEGFNIKFLYKTNLTFHIELIGVDSSIVNSLRRIIISEIATISINELYLFNNSSILNVNLIKSRMIF